MKLRLIGTKKITSDVTSFKFEPEQPVQWKPGQYFHYLLPHDNEDDRGHERWFTNSAAPSEGHIAITTRLNTERSSSFKKALQALQPGDEIEADGPKGSFTIEDPSQNYIFIAGGIGITPLRSILAEADTKGEKLKVDLLYANRTKEIPFADELDKEARNNPDLKIEYIVDPNKIDIDLLKQRIKGNRNPVIYISGPEPMVKAFAKSLADIGFPEQNTKTDDFPGYENY